jgi:hypothetical protein
MHATLPNGAKVQFVSEWQLLNNMHGYNCAGVWFDDAEWLNWQTFEAVIPRCSHGWVALTLTPRGLMPDGEPHWTQLLLQSNADWFRVHAPTYTNPCIDDKFLKNYSNIVFEHRGITGIAREFNGSFVS